MGIPKAPLLLGTNMAGRKSRHVFCCERFIASLSQDYLINNNIPVPIKITAITFLNRLSFIRVCNLEPRTSPISKKGVRYRANFTTSTVIRRLKEYRINR